MVNKLPWMLVKIYMYCNLEIFRKKFIKVLTSCLFFREVRICKKLGIFGLDKMNFIVIILSK